MRQLRKDLHHKDMTLWSNDNVRCFIFRICELAFRGLCDDGDSDAEDSRDFLADKDRWKTLMIP